MATVNFKGNPVHTNKDLPTLGEAAPDFELTAGDLSRANLASFAGKRKVLSIVPSLDTPVCAASARHFNQQASGMDNTVVLVISADLPFAQQRFCAAEGLDDVIPLSLMNDRSFAETYGVLLEDGPLSGLCTRAVLVVDEDDRVSYVQLVSEITSEPDYDSVLDALR
jgi:thiol peroxidase